MQHLSKVYAQNKSRKQCLVPVLKLYGKNKSACIRKAQLKTHGRKSQQHSSPMRLNKAMVKQYTVK